MYTIQLHECTPKQCVVLRGLRESTKYAVYNVRCIYPVFGFKNIDFSVFIFLGGVVTTGVFMRTCSALYFRSVKRCTETA